MKEIITEAFKWSVKEKQKNDGTGSYYIAYIDPKLSQDTFNVKDTLKKRFNMKWDAFGKYWYMILSSDPTKRQTQIDSFVKPAIEYLEQNSTEKGATPEESANNVNAECQRIIDQIDELINAINNGQVQQPQIPTQFNANELKTKLEGFKAELIASFQDGTFKEKMGPIIKFRQAQGTKYSFGNCILIMLQRPNAKMVKSKKKWELANKEVLPNAKPIALWCPIGKRESTPEEKREIEAKFLQRLSRKYGRPITVKDLNVGEREKLIDAKNVTVADGFKLAPYFYDLADVTQMNGKEDKIGNLDGMDDVEWYDNTTPEDAKSIKLYNAVIASIQSFGINLTYGDENTLGGARGVSKGGEIQVLQDAPKNVGTVSTLIHELSHEMLHQSYLKTKKDDFRQFFVGSPEGKELVEQQAEISAWIVLKYFGYDMRQAVNYAACWGADEQNAAYVMDSVALVAGRIIDEMNSNMMTMDESKINESRITGIDVAEMLGPQAVEAYKKSKMMGVTENFKSMLNKINEAEINTWNGLIK